MVTLCDDGDMGQHILTSLLDKVKSDRDYSKVRIQVYAIYKRHWLRLHVGIMKKYR